MKVRFFTFEQYHGKKNIGSTQIRIHNLIKYWEEAELYKYGENPDVMIFQKVYMQVDYKYIKHLNCIKILDICDADWLDKQAIKQTVDNVDAVTCSSKNLVAFIKQLTDKPVVFIDDRFDFEYLPKPKKHTGKLKKLVYFGYKQNAELLKSAFAYLQRNNYELTIISNEDPYLSDGKYKFIKYDEKTIYDELQKHDACLLPADTRPVGYYKSNNKTIKANLAGLPVVKTAEDIEAIIEPDKRQSIATLCYNEAIKSADCKISIKEYKKLIKELQDAKA